MMSSSSTFKFLLLSFIFVALTSAEDDSHPKGMVTKEKWDVHVTLNKSGGESEILDLTCQDDSHCQNYAINSKTSSCVNGKCVCQQKNFNQSVSCGNLSKIKTKIVGSSCEAAEPFCGSLADATCDDKSNTCICKDGHIESVDKRKCLAVEVELNSVCEFNEQCIRSDTNSFCDKHKVCSCVNNYINANSSCRQNIVLGDPPIHCKTTGQCREKVKDSVCMQNECVCGVQFTASKDNTSCLPDIVHRMPCLEDQQCQHRSGIGSTCNEKCVCRDKHLIKKIGHKLICMKQIYPGDHCENQADCTLLMGTKPTMECFGNACVCRKAYVIPGTDARCAEVSSSAVILQMNICMVILIIILLFKN